MPESTNPINSESSPCLEFVRLLHNLEYAGTITNGNNRFIYANRCFLDKYKCTYEEIDGLSPQVLLTTGSSTPGYLSSAKTSILGHEPWCGTIENADFEGNFFTAYLYIFPVRLIPDARPIGFIGVSTNPGNECEMLHALIKQLCTGSPFPGLTSLPVSPLVEAGGARRREILKLSRLGYSPKEIAGMMNISPSTVNVVKWRARKSNGTAKRVEKTIASE